MALADWQIEIVKQRWTDGYSFGMIATELGVSRSTVSGKIDRLGLEKREPKHSIPKKRGAPKKEKKTAPKRFAWARRQSPPVLAVVEATESAVAVPSVGTGVTFAELDMQRHCRFPLGDPGTEAFRYCGNAREFICTDDEIPHCYCAFHHSITHVPAPKRARAA